MNDEAATILEKLKQAILKRPLFDRKGNKAKEAEILPKDAIKKSETQLDKPMPTWLGHQECLYNGVMWHLKVPKGKHEKNYPADYEFSDGKYLKTDLRRAIGVDPKMYGFDIGRITEQNGENKLVTTFTPTERKDVFHHGEYDLTIAMMRYVWLQGGEVTCSHHLFSPLAKTPSMTTNPDDFLDLDLSAPQKNVQSEIILRKMQRTGQLCRDALEQFKDKTIYLRPFHEANLNFFWWGVPKVESKRKDYAKHFARFWKQIRETIENEAGSEFKSNLKFVMTFNKCESGSKLVEDLELFGFGSEKTTDLAKYTDGLGFDYYLDYGGDQKSSAVEKAGDLLTQYEILAKCARNHGLFHALSEIGMRLHISKAVGDKNKGKLYGGGADKQKPWIEPRLFFSDILYKLVKQFAPKWILFWANQTSNPVIGQFADYEKLDVFSNPDSSYYIPFSAPGISIGADFDNTANANDREAYYDAMQDFYTFVTKCCKEKVMETLDLGG